MLVVVINALGVDIEVSSCALRVNIDVSSCDLCFLKG